MAAALVVVAAVVVVTGSNLVHIYDSYISSCTAAHNCGSSPNPVGAADKTIQIVLAAIMLGAPALIGMFWGAPLIARELETGSYRLGWTQSATRRRWLAVKLVVVGLASVATVGLMSLMVTWWYSPLERANQDQFEVAIFGLRGLAPVGYAAFAFALGVTAGVLLRRTLRPWPAPWPSSSSPAWR